MKTKISVLLSASVLLIAAEVASATDPFPSVSSGQSIPGYRIQSSPGQSQSDWEQTATVQNFVCPEGTGKGAGVDMNFTANRSDDYYFYECIKTYQDPIVVTVPPISSTPPTESATATTIAPNNPVSDPAAEAKQTPVVAPSESQTAKVETTTATSLEIARLNAKIAELEELIARIMEFFKGWMKW